MVAEFSPRRSADRLAWLMSPEVIRADGAVMSWVNPDHPGYPYPEIAGYMLSYLALEGPSTASLRNRIAARIARDLTPSGAVGRNGTEYVFDSAMVLSGLMAHQANGGLLTDPGLPARVHDFISSRLRARVGIEGDAEAADTHWSQSYGCHLIKTVIALGAFENANPELAQPDLVEQLLDDLLPLYTDGRFRVNAKSNQTYSHAHCYAIEGLLVLEGRGRTGLRSWIEGGADWLASVQHQDGGMPASYGGQFTLAAAHGDCTSQAVRVWACVDPDRYADNIDRGVAFLEELAADGGLRYRRGSEDVNTWVTIFGDQAIEMADKGGSWQWLV